MSESKNTGSGRKMLTTVQKVQLYNWLSRLHDSRQLVEMTYDELLRLANDELPFTCNYGHIKGLLKETGWEFKKTKREVKFLKTELIERVKELESRIEDMASVLAMKAEIKAIPSNEWMAWVHSTFQQFNNRLNELERKLNMPMRVLPASSIRVVPPQGGSGTAPTGKH